MKFRWYHGLAALIILGGALAYLHHRAAIQQNASLPPVRWKTANPLIQPRSRSLVLRPVATAHTADVALPARQLRNAEWYLPIAPDSAVTFILHDGQTRWVIDGQALSLRNPPLDPADRLSYTQNGQALAWVRPNGGAAIETARSYQVIPQATAIAFNLRNQPVWVSGHHLFVNGAAESWTFQGIPAETHALLHHAQALITDDHGEICEYAVPAGRKTLLATVRPRRWPLLVTARHVSGGLAFLMERESALPRYLLVDVQHGTVRWYRFVSATPPELGVFRGQLVVSNVTANGNLAVIDGRSLLPLNVVPGIFSSGPEGVIWAGASGFVRLTGWAT
ncbi:MAG: hypothetical protein OWU84_04640 [Firmicutes bacterium]|nr:hypothetical protein [Bacillota bacterium]